MEDKRYVRLVCINAGSSSIKCAAFDLSGERIEPLWRQACGIEDDQLLFANIAAASPDAIVHRIVVGGPFGAVEITSPLVLDQVRRNANAAPLQAPRQLALVERLGAVAPRTVLCFDSAFHATMPRLARTVAIGGGGAQRYPRYGFHGLSYAFIASQIDWQRHSRVVVAHLGSGGSLCALRNGQSVDTTMGFSTLGGIVMATRPGDLDPGVVLGLLAESGSNVHAVEQLLATQSGLLALGGSTDMRELLARTDDRASFAVSAFVYSIVKAAGAMIAALRGIDAFVFTGGIGEGSPEIRDRICRALGFAGVFLAAQRNAAQAREISPDDAPVSVYRIETDEALQMAREAGRLLQVPVPPPV